jgi:Rho-binding antiterminator
MTPDPSRYHPIACDFHDLLEALATARKPAVILFLDAEGTVQQRTAILTDVWAREGAEYLSTSTGETVRLDRLVTVDGTRRPGGCSAAQP